MTYNFTEKDVLNKVIEIGKRFPDYTYCPPKGESGTCRYTNGANGQGCIVGQALRALGVPYAVLAEYDREYKYGVPASHVLMKLIDEDPCSDISIRLDRIQKRQDYGLSWGHCTP